MQEKSRGNTMKKKIEKFCPMMALMRYVINNQHYNSYHLSQIDVGCYHKHCLWYNIRKKKCGVLK